MYMVERTKNMVPKLLVARLGKGLAIRIPKLLSIHEGSAVELSPSWMLYDCSPGNCQSR